MSSGMPYRSIPNCTRRCDRYCAQHRALQRFRESQELNSWKDGEIVVMSRSISGRLRDRSPVIRRIIRSCPISTDGNLLYEKMRLRGMRIFVFQCVSTSSVRYSSPPMNVETITIFVRVGFETMMPYSPWAAPRRRAAGASPYFFGRGRYSRSVGLTAAGPDGRNHRRTVLVLSSEDARSTSGRLVVLARTMRANGSPV